MASGGSDDGTPTATFSLLSRLTTAPTSTDEAAGGESTHGGGLWTYKVCGGDWVLSYTG